MQESGPKRITLVILLFSAIAGIGFWYLTYEGAKTVTRKVAHKIDHLPHGPLPSRAVIPAEPIAPPATGNSAPH